MTDIVEESPEAWTWHLLGLVNPAIVFAGNMVGGIWVAAGVVYMLGLGLYGSGSQFESIASRESMNVTVNSFVSRDELLQKTNHIPFALVSLSPKITVEGFPGKTFDYLKMNKILIGFSNPNSSLAKFIEKYKLGINISPNEDNLDSKLQTLEDQDYIDQIYKNISEINNKFANVDAIADQYIKLI